MRPFLLQLDFSGNIKSHKTELTFLKPAAGPVRLGRCFPGCPVPTAPPYSAAPVFAKAVGQSQEQGSGSWDRAEGVWGWGWYWQWDGVRPLLELKGVCRQRLQ